MKNYLLYLSIFIIFFSCKKDKTPTLDLCLENHTWPVINLDKEINCGNPNFIHVTPYNYRNPTFNPTDPNEIAYLRKENSNATLDWEIWIVNLCNGRHRKSINKKVRKFDWSVQNTILFVDSNDDIWTAKSDGSEMKKILELSFTPNDVTWSPDGSMFTYTNLSPSQYFPITINYSLYDKAGNEIKTLEYFESEGFENLDWHKNKLYFSNLIEKKIFSYDLETDKFELAFELSGNLIYNYHRFNIINNNLYFSTNYGLYKLNLDTKTETLIEDYFELNRLFEIDVSLDESTIICNKLEYEEFVNCEIYSVERLMLVDTDGKNSRNILVP